MLKGIIKSVNSLSITNESDKITWWKELISGERYPAYALFLTTPLEPETLVFYNEKKILFAEELDAMTGPYIALLLLDGDNDFSSPESAVTKKLEHLYRFADAFNIDYSEFPALLLFTNLEKEEFVCFNFKNTSENELLHEIRIIFSIVIKSVKQNKNIIHTLKLKKVKFSIKKTKKITSPSLTDIGVSSIKKVLEVLIQGMIG